MSGYLKKNQTESELISWGNYTQVFEQEQRVSAHTCSTHPSLFPSVSAHIPADRSSVLRSAAPGWRDARTEKESVCPAGGEREREEGGRGAVRKATNEKRAKTQREKNQQAKAVLFIYLSPLRVFLGFVESRSSRRESGPRLRDFSLRELSRDVRDGLRLNPGTGFLDRTDAESARKRSRTHYHEYSLSDGCCGRRLRRAERESKADYCFVYTTFGQFPLDLHCYMPLIGAHWRKIPSCRGQAGLLSQWLQCFLTVILACIKKEKVQIFVFLSSTWPQLERPTDMLQPEQ